MPIWYVLPNNQLLVSNPYVGMTATTATASTLYLYPQTQTSTSAYNNHFIISGGTGGLQQQLLLQQYQSQLNHPLTPEDYQYLSLTPAERRMLREPRWAIPPPPPEIFSPAIIGAASKRAHEFLLDHLTPEQRKSFEKNRFFVIEGGKSKTKYRIRDAGHLVANIDVLYPDGTRKNGLCGHCANHDIPLYDSLLAQKFMLETSEEEFLKIANVHR